METKGPRRKARTVMASDSEWTQIEVRADTLDMPVSRCVMQQALTTTGRPPVDLQWRLVHRLVVLVTGQHGTMVRLLEQVLRDSRAARIEEEVYARNRPAGAS